MDGALSDTLAANPRSASLDQPLIRSFKFVLKWSNKTGHMYTPYIMAKPLDPNDLVTLEELPIANMWEVAGVIEVLENNGLLPKRSYHRKQDALSSS